MDLRIHHVPVDLWDDVEELHLSDDEADIYDPTNYRAAASASMKNESMEDDVSREDEDCTSHEVESDTGDYAMNCLEDLVLSFLGQLHDALPSAYSQSGIKRSGGKKIVLQLVNRSKGTTEDRMPMRTLVFPRRSPSSAKPFAQLFRVISLMQEALLDDVPTTKRDVYYKDVELFRSQSTVDRLVDDLAATFQVNRADLRVRASCKGLICGHGLTIHLTSGGYVETSDSEACLIPLSEDIECFEVGDGVAWVLVVEKEAVFQTLCRLRFAVHKALPGSGLIITGKGYPDVATRQLVKTLSDNLPDRIPILTLVDDDAYGIDIISVYKYGSTRMQHENEFLAAARIQWLGLWASELATLGISKDALLPITKHDEKKARTLLRRAELPAQWKKELQYMLFARRKAEIEVLGALRSSVEGINADLAVGVTGHDALYEMAKSGIPLVRYLVWKIRAACTEANSTVP